MMLVNGKKRLRPLFFIIKTVSKVMGVFIGRNLFLDY